MIECPVRPCEQVLDYNFYIDKVDSLTHIVYTHYSFQIRFDENGDYSVYIDGCCRPGVIKNKFGLPFHMRAGIQLYADGQAGGAARPYPKQSVLSRMPDVVMLREGGVAYDGCTNAPCENIGEETICFLRFQVQSYHPIEKYRNNLSKCESLFLASGCLCLLQTCMYMRVVDGAVLCRSSFGKCRRSWMVEMRRRVGGVRRMVITVPGVHIRAQLL